MMRYLNWTRAAILYEDEFGLVRLQDLVRTPPTKNLELYIRQTNPENYRFLLFQILAGVYYKLTNQTSGGFHKAVYA
jgi:ionotropic kainate glutamate receptor 2